MTLVMKTMLIVKDEIIENDAEGNVTNDTENNAEDNLEDDLQDEFEIEVIAKKICIRK